MHEGYIVEGELKSASAALWISYAYFRSYHDNVLIFYYFRDRNAANNGDPQTFAKVIASELDADVIVNLQGDEPLIEPSAIELLPTLLEHNTESAAATLAVPLTSMERWQNPNCAKRLNGARQ